MKTVIIILLSFMLLTAASLTRPGESSFRAMIRRDMRASANGFFKKLFVNGKIDSFLKSCTFKDRMLWTEVQKDGRAIYVGAFSHWVELNAGLPSAPRPALSHDALADGN